jgi:hypothetical protein
VRDDLAYPAMLTFLPHGLLGLVVASLAAAYMSTISTHLNWGSSYVVNDFYRRFVNSEASGRQLVRVGRLSTVGLMVVAALLALKLENALQAFQILLQIGAGTGLLFLLRWFWWRVNAWSELAAMLASFAVALGFLLLPSGLESWQELVIGVAVTTVVWVGVTLTTAPSDERTLREFYRLTRPGGPGWRPVVERAAAAGAPIERAGESWGVPGGVVRMFVASVGVYGALFATGYTLYGRWQLAVTAGVVAMVATAWLVGSWRNAG